MRACVTMRFENDKMRESVCVCVRKKDPEACETYDVISMMIGKKMSERHRQYMI